MVTEILDPEKIEDINKAGDILKKGGLVAIPTETVYGLAADALNPKAVEKIYEAKGRPSDNPLIVHVAEVKEVYPLVKEFTQKAKQLTDKFWPGALTIILPKSDLVPNITSGYLDTVAVRMPNNSTALEIIKAAKTPLAAPSANVSGRPSPTKFEHVYYDMNGKIDAIIKGSKCNVGVESTVISLVGDTPKILRPGAISQEDIELVIGKTEMDSAVLEQINDSAQVSSPGMKYKHYSPKAEVIISRLNFYDYKALVESDKDCCALCFDEEKELIYANSISYGKKYDSESQAKNLFSALRKIDKLGYKKAYVSAPKLSGVGLAVYNRLIRAANFKEIKPDINIIGLTGKSGSGKTTVASEMEKFGAKVIDCDAVTKDTKTYTEKCIKLLQSAFGDDILYKGELNRKKLAHRAFSSKENLDKLNSITLPFIIERINIIVEKYKTEGYKNIVLDAPTLFEANADLMCNYVIVVSAVEKLRLKRIIDRDNLSEEQAALRIKAQKPDEFFKVRADMVIDTTNNIEAKQIEDIFNYLNK